MPALKEKLNADDIDRYGLKSGQNTKGIILKIK
jgi:hypothetical protein